MAWFRKNGSVLPAPGEEHMEASADAPAVATFQPPQAAPAPAAPDPQSVAQSDWYVALKRQLHQQVIGEIDLSTIGTLGEDQLRLEIRRKAEAICQRNARLLNLGERERLINEVLDEAFGLGPLEPLFRDPTVSDILINGPKTVYVERRGRLEKSTIAFHDSRHLLQIVQRIAAKVGRRIDETSPMVDARLPDGSRLNAIIAPLALEGPLVSIRRFSAKPLLIEDLVRIDSLTKEMVQFLEACVYARINIIISGGTGSGKTTLLNALSRFIPEEERVATIEDAAELQLQQSHVAKMETRPANVEGSGEVNTRDLVRNALRMRPDRIIVGECRGSEAFDMLQAMNTGHEGSLTTVHANTPRDAVSRIEMMVGMAGFELPIWVIRKQIVSSINIIVQASRLMGGPRKITKISEVTGMEGDVITMHDLFEFVQTGLNEKRMAVGYHRANGMRPECLAKLEACGINLPAEMFERRRLDGLPERGR